MLQYSVFTDTIQAGNVSRRLNQYAQVYSTDFGLSRSHTMKTKGDAHETLTRSLRETVHPRIW